MFNIPPKEQKVNSNRKFVIVSQDTSGEGWAKMLVSGSAGRGNPREEHNTEVIFSLALKDDEEDIEQIKKVGEGIFECIPFDEIWKHRKQYKDYIFIFDQNHNWEKAEQLRIEGFMVFGGLQLSDMMEHDRDFGISLIEKAGLDTPETQEFTGKDDGLEFLDENYDRAWVFKPDEPDGKSWVTTCPDHDNDEKANREIYNFLKSQSNATPYILQERVKGVEINVEFFVYKGTPFFAQANFECKRKYNGDYGKMIGCAQDTCFVIPLESKILKDTLWKLVKLPEFKDYTGFLDLNLIVADNKYYFLEFCARFGYNSHPNLFLSLSLSPFSEIMSDWVLGDIKEFGKHFRAGYGASITCWIDDLVTGLPLSFDDMTDESRFYPYDTYEEDGETYLAGYSNEVGVIVAHDYDLKSACEEAVSKYKRVHYPGKCGRTDLAETNYMTNPLERLTACKEMGLFEAK